MHSDCSRSFNFNHTCLDDHHSTQACSSSSPVEYICHAAHHTAMLPLYVFKVAVPIYVHQTLFHRLYIPTNAHLLATAGAILRSAGSPTPCSTMGISWMDAALHSALPLPLAWPRCASWKPRGATSSTRRAAAVLPTRLKHKLWCRSALQSCELMQSMLHAVLVKTQIAVLKQQLCDFAGALDGALRLSATSLQSACPCQ